MEVLRGKSKGVDATENRSVGDAFARLWKISEYSGAVKSASILLKFKPSKAFQCLKRRPVRLGKDH